MGASSDGPARHAAGRGALPARPTHCRSGSETEALPPSHMTPRCFSAIVSAFDDKAKDEARGHSGRSQLGTIQQARVYPARGGFWNAVDRSFALPGGTFAGRVIV